ncbi:hypothetical protein BGP_2302 [Beggiatoa sp. PS]|nr:hypothetical protein BGP_2302 [Beggiatoa sp. PS]
MKLVDKIELNFVLNSHVHNEIRLVDIRHNSQTDYFSGDVHEKTRDLNADFFHQLLPEANQTVFFGYPINHFLDLENFYKLPQPNYALFAHLELEGI